jgi:hypothetical protein
MYLRYKRQFLIFAELAALPLCTFHETHCLSKFSKFNNITPITLNNPLTEISVIIEKELHISSESVFLLR